MCVRARACVRACVRNIAKLPQNNRTLAYRTVSRTVRVVCELGMCPVAAAGGSGFVRKAAFWYVRLLVINSI